MDDQPNENSPDSITVRTGQLERQANARAKPGDKVARRANRRRDPGLRAQSRSATPNPTRFRRPENVLGLIFLGVLFFNLHDPGDRLPPLHHLRDLPAGTTVLFFLLWLGMFVRILEPLEHLFQRVYVFGNAQFYFIFSLVC